MKKFLISLVILLDPTLSMKRARPDYIASISEGESKKNCIEWNPSIRLANGMEHIEELLRLTKSIDLSEFFSQLQRASDTEMESLLIEIVGSNMVAARFVFTFMPSKITERLYFHLSTVSEEIFKPGDEILFTNLGFEITSTTLFRVLERGCSDWFLMHSVRRLSHPNLPVQVLHLAMLQSRRNNVLLEIIKFTPHVSMEDVYLARRHNIDCFIVEMLLRRVPR